MSISTELRRLPENLVAISDDHGGWRLETRHPSGTLSSVQDTHGLVVDIIRAAGGRPVGLLLGEDLAVEYIYSPGAGPWMRKVLYDLNTSEVLADVTNEGRMVEVSVQPADLSASSDTDPMIEQFETCGGGWHLVSIIEERRYALLPLETEGIGNSFRFTPGQHGVQARSGAPGRVPPRRTASRIGWNRWPGEIVPAQQLQTPIPDLVAAATSTPRTGGGCRHETQEAAKSVAALGGPRGGRAPAFARCLRIASTTSWSMMNAMIRISPPHFGHTSGSTS